MLGEQWVWWDPRRRTIAMVPRDPARVRLTINRIRPNLNILLAKLMKRSLAWEVLPTGTDDATVEGARLAERLLTHMHDEQGWEDVRDEVLFNAYAGGTAGVCIEWDGQAGSPLGYDPATDRMVGTGEVTLTPLSIGEMALDPGTRDPTKARWWVRAVALSPAEAQDRFRLKDLPKPSAETLYSPLQQKLLGDLGRPVESQQVLALTYFERPNRSGKGQIATVIGDKIVDGPHPWNFPFDRPNVIVFRQQKIPGRWYGDTLLNDAYHVQVAYNHARSVLAEHMKLAGNARLMVPDAALDMIDELTDEAGEVVPFNAQAGTPFYLAPPNLPRWVIQEADRLSGELDDIMAVHAISRGEGAGAASGVGLSLLAEKDDTPLGRMAGDQSKGWADVGRLVLELYEVKATESRELRIVTNGVPITKRWNGKTLRGQTNAQVPIDNVLPHSRVALQAWARDLWDRKIITDPGAFAAMADLPDQERLAEVLDADVANATHENDLIASGVAILPEPFDDDAKHIAQHNRWRKSDAYRWAEPVIRKTMDDHVKAHENQQAEQLARQQMKAQVNPALAMAPQGDEPPGSMVPMDHQEAQALTQQTGNGGGAGSPGPSQPPGPGGFPGMSG